MSNCLCLACDRSNSITTKFCTQCGAKLQIQERYRALKVIGQGGFGKTFLAQDESKPSQPRCVIKQFAFETINPNASQGTLDVAIRLFEQEAKRLDDLGKHPQIPELLSFTIHEGKQYLIQEFIDGETLEQELARVGAFSEQQVRDVLVEVLQILEFVHSKSVIHRDISPDNIIRRRSDQKLVLVDFGAAKHATATLLAKTGTGIGKPSYGAPEQMLGKSVFQSDLFGLGVTCLHLLTNVEPFTLYDVLENEYQWRQFLNGKIVSDEFGKLLDRLTAYRVKERPNSVTESLQELGVGRKTSTSLNASSGIYSFKAEELQAEHRVSISSAIPNKQATKTTSSNNTISNQNVPRSPVELRSAKGIDYRELEQFLKIKEWRKADELTTKLMLKGANREKEGYLNTEHIETFPCEDLRTIDQLWVYFSDGKFGFSIQKNHWQRCGGKIGEYDWAIYQKFATKVEWEHPEDWIISGYERFMNATKNANKAFYASLPLLFAGYGGEYRMCVLFSRIDNCRISSNNTVSNQNVPISPVELRSAKGIDYRGLENLLKVKEWRKADELTAKLMMKAMNREKENWLDTKHMETFPHEDLNTIDHLWLHYSNGKFGFSVQKKLWLECGGKIGKYDYDVFRKFALKVGWSHESLWTSGWLTYSKFMEDTKDAQKSLPASLPWWYGCQGWWWLGWVGWDFGRGIWSLLSRKEL